MVEDVLVGSEDAVRKPVVAHELPDVLDRVQFGRFGRQRDERDVWRDGQRLRDMPACLIKDEDGVCARRHGGRYLFEMQGHRLGITGR